MSSRGRLSEVYHVTECPVCGKSLDAPNAIVGEIVACGDCGTELEVRALDPLTVSPAPPIEEDWGE